MKIKKTLGRALGFEKRLAERVFDGVKHLPAKDISAFIIQNAAEGFARGLVQEMKKNE